MKIGEVSKRTNLSVDTLRFYEKIGLISSPWRKNGRTRIYDPDILVWIQFLKALKSTGMPLAEMRRYADLRQKGISTSAERRVMLESQRKLVEARIEDLTLNLSILDTKINSYLDIELNAIEMKGPS